MGKRWTWVGVGAVVAGALALLLLLRPPAAIEIDDAMRAGRPIPDAGEASLRGASPGGTSPVEAPASADRGEASAPEAAVTRLSGRVLDAETGAAVSGAWVHGPAKTAEAAERVVSGADGRYELLLPAAGPWRVVVLGGGWYSAGLTVATSDGFDPYLVDPARVGHADHDLLVEEAATVRGHVYTATREPAPNAQVALHSHFPWGAPLKGLGIGNLLTTPTDADGSYRFAALVPGCHYRVYAAEPDGIAVHSERYEAERGEERVVDLELARARHVHVRVIDASSGDGLPGVAVWTEVPAFPGDDPPGRKGTTDDDGRVTLGPIRTGPADAIAVGCSKPQWHTLRRSFEGESPTEDARVTVELEQGLPIRGRVLEPGDVPTSFAWLVLEKKGELDPDDLDPGIGSQPDGGFFLGYYRPGSYTIGVVEQGALVAQQDVEAGQEDIVIRLPRALTRPIRIRVLAPDGEPIPRFQYACVTSRGWSSSGDHSFPSLPLMLGPFADGEALWVEIQAAWDGEGAVLPLAPLSLGPLAPTAGDVQVRLVPASRIAGRVLDANGAGVGGVSIQAWPLDRGSAQGRVGGSHGSSRTDPEGRFDLIGLAAARYLLYVEAGPGHAPAPRPVIEAGRTDVEIRLDAGTRVDLVLVEDDGTSVPGADVQVFEPHGRGWVCRGETDSQGRVRLEGLSAARTYELRVQPPRDRADLAPFVVATWTVKDTKVSAHRGASIHGTVVDEDGEPVSGVVAIALTGARHKHNDITDERGAFSIGGLPLGRVLLLARRPGEGGHASAPAEAEAGAEEVQLVLRLRSRLVVHFTGWPEGVLREGMVLRDVACPAATYPGSVGEGASVVFAGVAPDRTYSLFELLRAGGATRVAYAADLSGDAGSVKVAVRPAAAIEGVVTGPRDAILPVVRIDERGVEAKTLAGDDGTFRLEGLPEGEWTLTATARSAHARYRGSVRARTGTPAAIPLHPVK